MKQGDTMPTKKAIKIALTEKEEALLHYESYFGKNASVKKHVPDIV